MIRFLFLTIAIAVSAPLLPGQVAEVVPAAINYQGRLVDADGRAIGDGSYTIEFELFDAPAGGEALWAEERTVIITSGLFHASLGGGGGIALEGKPHDLAAAFSGAARYVEIRITGGPEIDFPRTLAPRQQLFSVPFAIQAQDAHQAVNADHLAGERPAFYSPPGMISAYGGANDPNGWLICDGRELLIADFPELFAAIGTNFGGNGVTTFRIPDGQGLVLRGTGSHFFEEREKVGPALGAIQEDQMQRLTGHIAWHRMAHPNPNSGVGRGGVFRMDSQGSARESSGLGGSDHVRRLLFDSADSPNARASETAAGETRVSSLGVNYIIKY